MVGFKIQLNILQLVLAWPSIVTHVTGYSPNNFAFFFYPSAQVICESRVHLFLDFTCFKHAV